MEISKIIPYVLSGVSTVFAAGMWFQRDKYAKYDVKNIKKEVDDIKKELITLKEEIPSLEERRKTSNDIRMLQEQYKEQDIKIEDIRIEEAKIFTKLDYIEKMTDKIDKKLDRLNSK